jgi:hypothetical protein
MTKHGDVTIGLSYPPGWIQLPIRPGGKLDRDKDLEAWADSTARRMLAGAPAAQVTERARDLAELTVSCRARRDLFGLVFYLDAHGLVAMLHVRRHAPDRDNPVVTLDLLEKIYASGSADVVGEIETARVALPSGPAVRVRGKRVEGRAPTGHGALMEDVTHAIQPPGFEGAVVATMTWAALQLGDKLATMADAIAKTIRVTLA